MRVAYADPPYIGCSKKHYGDHPDYQGEVDHAALIDRLQTYDGWALSCHVPSLRILLPMCPEKTRICAWVKPFAVWKPGVSPAYAWEPVLMVPARKRKPPRVARDWVSASCSLVGARMRTHVTRGAKPDEFCYWLFDALGLEPGDVFEDLFPGSGAVARAWERWCKAEHLMPGSAGGLLPFHVGAGDPGGAP